MSGKLETAEIFEFDVHNAYIENCFRLFHERVTAMAEEAKAAGSPAESALHLVADRSTEFYNRHSANGYLPVNGLNAVILFIKKDVLVSPDFKASIKEFELELATYSHLLAAKVEQHEKDFQQLPKTTNFWSNLKFLTLHPVVAIKSLIISKGLPLDEVNGETVIVLPSGASGDFERYRDYAEKSGLVFLKLGDDYLRGIIHAGTTQERFAAANTTPEFQLWEYRTAQGVPSDTANIKGNNIPVFPKESTLAECRKWADAHNKPGIL